MTDSPLDPKLTKQVLASLNRILELELAGVVRYMHYSFMIFGHNRIPIVAWLREQGNESNAHAVLAALPGGPLAYARVDLIRAADGSPCLLELELTEPSLFFLHAEGSADRFAAALLRRLSKMPVQRAAAGTAG